MVNSSYNTFEPLLSIIIHNNPTQKQEEEVLVNTTTNNNTKKILPQRTWTQQLSLKSPMWQTQTQQGPRDITGIKPAQRVIISRSHLFLLFN